MNDHAAWRAPDSVVTTSANAAESTHVSMPQHQQDQYLSFIVGGEEFALGILEVREIVELTTLTKIPSAHAAVCGVVNLRGKVVPVVDLAVRFGLPRAPPTKRTCVVVIETEWEHEFTTFGLLADSVSQVVELVSGSVQPPPKFGTKVCSEYVKGLASVGDRFVLVLELQSVLHSFFVDAGQMTSGSSEPLAQAAMPP